MTEHDPTELRDFARALFAGDDAPDTPPAPAPPTTNPDPDPLRDFARALFAGDEE